MIEEIRLTQSGVSTTYESWRFFWSESLLAPQDGATHESLSELDSFVSDLGGRMISYLRDFSPLGLTPLTHLETSDIHHLSSERSHLSEPLKCESIVRLSQLLADPEGVVMLTRSPTKIQARLASLDLPIPRVLLELPPRTLVTSHTVRGLLQSEYSKYFRLATKDDIKTLFIISDDILTPLLLTIKKRSDDQEVDI